MRGFVFDSLTHVPSIIAANRIRRPDATGVTTNAVKSTEPKKDPNLDVFAKGNEHLTPGTVYQDSDDWNVRVFKNKFPLVDDHEVIVHSPDLNLDLEDLPQEQVVRYVRAILHRVFEYHSKNMEVFVFNNRGGQAGASLIHPHSQLIALKGFPGRIEEERHGAIEYYNQHDACYWCDAISHVQAEGGRLVYETKHFVVMSPRAPRWSHELKLLPKRHAPNFGLLDEIEINDFAKVLKAVLNAYNVAFNRPARNFWIHTQRNDPYHWHLGFIPNIKVLGSVEIGAGIWVSDRASPEDSAALLGPLVKQYYESENVTTLQ